LFENDQTLQNFFQEKFISKKSSGEVECSSDSPIVKLSTETRTTPAQNQQIRKTRKKTSEHFLWTRRMQFWQPHRKIFDKKRRFSTRCPKKISKKCFYCQKKYFSTESSNRHVECRFDIPAGKDLTKTVFAQCAKTIINSIIFFKKNFSVKKSSGDVECSSESPTVKLSTETQTTPAQNPQMKKNSIRRLLDIFNGVVECSFDKAGEEFL